MSNVIQAQASPVINQEFTVIVPAAGVGKRMLANCPKQYLEINQQSILSHTVNRLLTHKNINKVIVVVSDDDEYFAQTTLASNESVRRVSGGKERVDSVLNGLYALNSNDEQWVLVHDAARPCVTHQDIDALIQQCLSHNIGGLLAAPVTDTIKQCCDSKVVHDKITTVDRSQLWQAFTPQMFKLAELIQAIEQANEKSLTITDESSAIELAGLPSMLVAASKENIKITRPEDLALAEFYLTQQAKNNHKETLCE